MRSTSVADAIGSGAEDELRSLMGAVESEGHEVLIGRLEAEMLDAARKLEFERAASLRDRIDEVKSSIAMAESMGMNSEGVVSDDGSALSERPSKAGSRGSRRRPHRFGRSR